MPLRRAPELERLEQALGNRKGVNQQTRHGGDPPGETVDAVSSSVLGFALRKVLMRSTCSHMFNMLKVLKN
jgi:hypothetical protein